MNLAPLKFRDVLASDGGPIRTVDVGTETILGRDQYSAHAYLCEDLYVKRQTSAVITKMPDGAGTASDPNTAKFRAISEALERWAFGQCSIIESYKKELGFDYDPTTNGMGAFPGLFDTPARLAAEREAIERHCLVLWWEGFLDVTSIADPFPGVRGIQIENPFSDDIVVLLWQFVDDRFYIYGFGLGTTMDDACWRAGVEMYRTGKITRSHYAKNDSIDEAYFSEFEHLFEKRILFYSRPDGFIQLLERLETRPIKRYPGSPDIIVDRKVTGPWDRFVTVWRVVYRQPSREFASDRADYFFW
ncbi:MAG: hypothetical protein AAFX93_05820 [Verrucomicrobiota bacterium]